MEAGIEFVLYNNQWERVKEKIIRDLIENKIAGLRVRYDSNMDIRVRYVDPVRTLLPYVDNDNFSNLEYCGEEIEMSIAEIRREGNLSEDEIFEIAKYYQNKNSNTKLQYPELSYY